MPGSNWKYAQNQFLRVSGRRRPLLLTIGADHTAKLHAKVGNPADPEIQTCIDRVQPRFDDFQLKMVIYDVRSGTRKGQTEMLDVLLQELILQRLPTWDATVQLTYLATTPQYTQIFPDGRSPFGTGGKDMRILAVQTLAQRLAAFPAFATLQTSVETFYASLNSARDTQQGTEGEIKSASDAAEMARIALANGLYANVGTLMAKHMDEPWKLEEYFELALLRKSGGGSSTPPPPVTEEELKTFRYGVVQTGPTTAEVRFEMPEGLTDVQTLFVREGTVEFATAVSVMPGEVWKTPWSGVVIDGDIDEVKLRNGQNEDVATGVRDETLPDPGP